MMRRDARSPLSSAASRRVAYRRPVTTFTHETELWLPRPPDEVFAFFADAGNLERLTPPFLQFSVVTPQPIDMREGATIDYKLKVHGLPLRWRSRISAWQPPHRFVDEQIKGPYRKWVHEHTFEPRDGGTFVRDHVDYAVLGGRIVNKLFVRRDLERIFAFRTEKLQEIFGSRDDTAA